jgi:NAD-dependent deacetylase
LALGTPVISGRSVNPDVTSSQNEYRNRKKMEIRLPVITIIISVVVAPLTTCCLDGANAAAMMTTTPAESCSSSTPAMDQAIQATAAARRLVIFSGAGMSADSGVGTFRGVGGVWGGLYGTLALFWGGTPIGWKWTPSFVWRRFVYDFVAPILAATPHEGHTALAQLWSAPGALFDSVHVITMNVDGLHQAAGFPPDHVSEVHGSVLRYRCMSCDTKLQLEMPLDASKQPRCPVCGGRARPDVTLFTEALPSEEWQRAIRAIRQLRRGDVLLVAGTSSVVYPAASLPGLAKREQGATVIEFNLDVPTPLSDLTDITVQGRAAETLPVFVQGVLDKKQQRQQEK